MRSMRVGRFAVLFGVLLFVLGAARIQAGEKFIAYPTPAGTMGNQADFPGALGHDFDVNIDILVHRLGVFDHASDGLKTPITAHLYERGSLADVAVIAFTPGDEGELIGGARFKPLPAPLALPAGSQWTIVAEGYGAAELDGNRFDPPPPWSMDSGTCDAVSFVGGGRWGLPAGVYPANLDGGPPNRYAGPNFEFEITGALPATRLNAIAYHVPAGTAGNQEFPAGLGHDFDVKSSIAVTHLGVFDDSSNGLKRTITARIYDRETKDISAEMVFTPEEPGTLIEGSRFKPLDEPLSLEAGFKGSVVVYGYGAGERNGNTGVGPLPGLFTDNAGCAVSFVGGGRWGEPATPDAFPQHGDARQQVYAAGTFWYTTRDPAQAPALGGLGLGALGLASLVSGAVLLRKKRAAA